MNELEARFKILVPGIMPVGAAALPGRMTERMQIANAHSGDDLRPRMVLASERFFAASQGLFTA